MQTKHILFTGGLMLAAWSPALGQEALKIDPVGRPLTTLNLSSPNVTGTLAAERLPANVGELKVVQTVTAAGGPVTVTSGTNVVMLAVPLTAPLTLMLPPANGQTAGGKIAVADPGGYSRVDCPVQAAPGGQDTLDGASDAKTVLAGRGAGSLWADGEKGWNTDGLLHGANRIEAGPDASLGMSPGAVFMVNGQWIALGQGSNSKAEVAVFDQSGGQAVRINGTGTISSRATLAFEAPAEVHRMSAGEFNVQGSLSADGTISMDSGLISSDGNGGLFTGSLTCQGAQTLTPVDPGQVQPPANGGVTLYVSSVDGKLHALDQNGADHALW